MAFEHLRQILESTKKYKLVRNFIPGREDDYGESDDIDTLINKAEMQVWGELPFHRGKPSATRKKLDNGDIQLDISSTAGSGDTTFKIIEQQ